MADDPSPSQTGTAPPDGTPGLSTAEPDYRSIGAQHAAGLLDTLSVEHLQKAAVSAMVESAGATIATMLQQAPKLAVGLGKALEAIEDPMMPILAGIVTPIIAGMFGADVDASAFASRANAEGRVAAAGAIVDAFLAAITGDADGPMEPGMGGAKRIAGAGLQAALEGWLNAALPEVLSDVLPFEMGHFDMFTRLPEEVIATLGIGRLIRSAILPLVNATATQPMAWYANKLYRPAKLGVSTAVRQLARGRWTIEQLNESLARDGYRDEDIEALVNEQAKFLTVEDLAWMVWQGEIGIDEAVQGLGDQGYDGQTASKHLLIQGLKREDAIHREIATAATTAYADGRIDGAELDGLLSVTIQSDRERALMTTAAQAKRELRALALTPAEAEACFLANIVPLSDYRAALERVGRTPDAVDALELLLRAKVDKKTTIEEARAQQAAAKAAAAKARADAAAARKAAVDAAAAVRRLGPVSELSRAVVRGLIPVARLQEVLSANFDADTVQIYTEDVDAQRAAFLAQQQRAADAAKRAAATGLSTGELQTALVEGVLDAGQVGTLLAGKGLAAADVDVLLATMQDAASVHADAVKAHALAVQRASAKQINLGQAEALVRGGHWTIAQYNALLSSLGFTDAPIADLDLLVQDAIAKDQAAAAIRRAASKASPTKGLSLAQARQAVVLGLAPIGQYQTFLINEGYTADAIATLMAEAADAVSTAEAARARRAAASAVSVDGSGVTLSDVTKAARLGLITPDAYAAQLAARGYSADDVALEMDLLATEIAAAGGTGATGLSPGASAGASSSPLAAASSRHVAIDGELTARGLSLGEVEASVKAGLTTLDNYESWLQANGFSAADAALLRALLVTKLPASGG